MHKCSTEYGSSGGPIILLNTFKAIGAHKGSSKYNFDFNLGTLLKYPILDFNKNIKKAKRKFLIPVFGKTGVGRTTLIQSILKIEPLEEPNPEEVIIYENENVIPNLSFLDAKSNNYEYNVPFFKEQNDKIFNFIKKKFDTNKPENYIDCFWFCLTGCRIECMEFDFFKYLMIEFSEIPLILVYTHAYDANIVEEVNKFLKFNNINIDVIPVMAKKIRMIDNIFFQPYGIDILLKETIEKCENRRKTKKNY